MTTFQLCLVVFLIAAVLCAFGIVLMRGAAKLLDGLSADAGLDSDPYQPRASTLREPTDRDALSIALIVIAAATLALLWCGRLDGLVRWAVGR